MRQYSIKECQPGDLVLTGDQYGKDVCICLGDYVWDSMNTKRFLCLTDFSEHESTYDTVYEDECYLIARIPDWNLAKFHKDISYYISQQFLQ